MNGFYTIRRRATWSLALTVTALVAYMASPLPLCLLVVLVPLSAVGITAWVLY